MSPTTTHRVRLVFSGSVFFVTVALEGHTIPLALDPSDGLWKSQEFTAFPIDGRLDTYLFCNGLNGTKWKLTLFVDDRTDERTDDVRKGVGYLGEEIALPLPNVA